MALAGVTVRYPGARFPSLSVATLDVPDGQVTGVAGASEAGKSTLCLVLAGLVPRVMRASVEGSVAIDGDDVTDRPMHELCARVGTLTGAPDAMLSLVADTVFEEVAFGPVNLGLPRDEVLRRVGEALATAGIDGLAERDPRRLSTGQTQLVALGGLLAMGSRNLVLDEPGIHLDRDSSARLTGLLRRLAADGAAVLLASSDTGLLGVTCDRVAVLDGGRLGPVGPTADVLSGPGLAEAGLEPVGSDR